MHMARRFVTGAITTLIAPYGRTNSGTVTARLSSDQLSRVAKAADRDGQTIGAYARTALVRLTTPIAPGGTDSASQLKQIAIDLGLQADADPSDVLAAVQALVDELTTASDSLEQQPDAKPAQLSASDRAVAAKMTPKARAAFVALRQKFTAPITRVIQSKPKAKK